MTDNREIAHRNEGGAVAHRPQGGIPIEQRMAMLREVLTNPEVDPQKAVAMADLMFKLEDRDRQAEFNRDLIAAKAEIGPIFKRGENTHQHTRYAKFEDIQRVTDPVLERHNLDLSYKIGSEGPNITVVPVLRHTNGWEWEGLPIKGPADSGPGRSAIQAVGSSASYLQRYAAKATLNLRFDGEDNDGASGVGSRLNDRQEQIVVEAQAAADRGEYPAWYARLPAKDKALLVTQGVHAQLGGGATLPGNEPTNRNHINPGTDGRADRAYREPEKPAHDTKTAEGWTAQYEDDCAAAPDREALLAVQARGQKAMDKLRATPELHERAVKAGSDALARLNGGEA